MPREGYFGLAVGLLAIIAGVLQGMYPVIPAIIGWPIVAILGFAAFVLCDIGIRKKEYEKTQNREVQHTQTRQIIEPQKGSLDSVSSQDRQFIVLLATTMTHEHGHMDIQGLLADRASGIALNELMARNCSRCGCPRNDKTTEIE